MLKAEIRQGEQYAVPCAKVDCHPISREHVPMPEELAAIPRPLSPANLKRVEAHMNDPRRVLHRCLVIAVTRKGVEIEVPPGAVRLQDCTCPECRAWHVGTRETTEPERRVISSWDIACHWDQAHTWVLMRGRSGISFGDVDAELQAMLGPAGGDAPAP